MNKARVNRISGGQMMCLLTLSRLTSLLLVKSLSLTLLLAEFTLSAGLSLAAWFVCQNEMLTEAKPFRWTAAALFFAVSAWDCVTYYQFTANVVRPEVPMAVIIAVFAVFTMYSGLLGNEAVARFSSIAAAFAAAGVLIAVLTNISNLRLDFFVYSQSEKGEIINLAKCFDVPLLFCALSPVTANKKGRALSLANALPYGAALAVVLFSRAVLGKTANLYSSPIFALFQLGKAGSFTKLDILFVCLMLVLLLCETSAAVSLVKLLVRRGRV